MRHSGESRTKAIDESAQGLPLFVQFENVPSNLRPHYSSCRHVRGEHKAQALDALLTDNFFNTPVTIDGKPVQFEDVVKQLERDTISYQISGGGRIGDYEGMVIQFQVEPEKYQTIIQWLRTLMFDSIFDPVRIKAALVKALADIPEAKRDGRSMALEVDMALHSGPGVFPHRQAHPCQGSVLPPTEETDREGPGNRLWGGSEELSRSLFTFQNTRVLVTADVAKLPNPRRRVGRPGAARRASDATTPP